MTFCRAGAKRHGAGSAPRRPAPRGPAVGESLGRYCIVGYLGRGASARVYAARDGAGREVALKVVHAPTNMTQVMRLALEAEVLGRLRHPGVLRAEGPVASRGPWRYLALEALRGPTLRQAEGEWTAPRLSRLARQLAEALGAVHAESLVHCDVKPDNLVLTRAPDGGEQVVLIDFDAARWLDSDTGRRAAVLPSGTVFGTPGYMAPEQQAGDDIDARADVYAYGAVLYELMTGERAAAGLLARWKCRRRLRDAGWGGALGDLVLTCLSELPEQRPALEAILREI